MTSTMRPLPQLRIIQQQFHRKDKRPYSSTVSSSGKAQTSEDDEDAYEDESRARFSNSSSSNHTSTSEPPTKVRKKPGRKPNPASPAVRKEQNRAAQRAFRDRKERHLQDMENMIKELREANAKMTSQLQQDAQQFKTTMESLQSENYYLRQVVFSFEAAMNRGGNEAVLQEVKEELYRRHYDKHSQKKLSGSTSPSQDFQAATPPTSSMFLPNGYLPFVVVAEGPFVKPPSDLSTSAAPPAIIKPCVISASPTPPSVTSPSSPSSCAPTAAQTKVASSTLWSGSGRTVDIQDGVMATTNNNVPYNVPSLYCMVDPNGGRLIKSIASCEPPALPRPFFTETGAYLAKRTEYTKNGSVFDELQSSLFPPGTLQSIIHTGLATPQEIVNDLPLLEQLHNHYSTPHQQPLRDPVIAPGQAAITFCSAAVDAPSPSDPTSILDDDSSEFEMSTPTLGLDDGLKQNVIPSKRLQLEIQVLASAPPAVDPNIDPKIYALPHDTRIDLIPCPRLRAQMILHQKKFDVEDLCKLLINGARCHGHPLDPHSWELPEEFFDRYGFLLGQEMLRHRNKIWPKKDEPLLETILEHYAEDMFIHQLTKSVSEMELSKPSRLCLAPDMRGNAAKKAYELL
ncbi:hypothetical protein EDD11_005875 [Mortierella claussenii]|nr:hypothetical protein EDD11_005875 [Mortierella claussenii]